MHRKFVLDDEHTIFALFVYTIHSADRCGGSTGSSNQCHKDGCKIAVMVKIGTFKKTDFKRQSESGIDLIRFLIPRKDGNLNRFTKNLLDKSLDDITMAQRHDSIVLANKAA